ncbi:protein Z-dependent protease inhibitor-like [Gouania willdenowi]|uniref:protein Z-dependent protease inhibitor-like n=1 Tax=Gouania willdenowi TaxID=441366 RepID=UPI001054C63F|nr:protein Z-dependent protease inhibitor-like [Gouania willdenowi]XP_028296398.1 protein Z-dependent protease inhibitor-like [Gouania willdenowi]
MTSCMTAPLILVLVLMVSAQTLDPSVTDLNSRMSEFGAGLYRSVAKRSDDNMLLAPFTLTAGLLALLSATDGPTQNQLIQSLSLSGLSPSTIPDLFQTLRNLVLTEGLNLQQGWSLLPPQGFQTSSSFLLLVQEKFGGKIQSLPYTQPDEAMDAINRWAAEQSGERVKELLRDLQPQTELLLASVASYQAHFSPPFNASFTQDERFYVDSYHTVMVPMMLRADKYFLAYDAAVKAGVLKLPMADGTAMLAVLPDEGVDVGSIESELTAEKIKGWIRQLKKTRLEVQLPHFRLEVSYRLKDFLQTLDITQVFQDNGDILNMGEDKSPKLTEVFQKSVLLVDDSSDDITSGGVSSEFSTPPPRLTFNRPFVFIVYQQSSSSVLMIGRVHDPTPK